VSRSERLLALLQILRGHRSPVSGTRLAEETGVSLRTVYRDLASLQAQGASIEGAPGLGYVMKPGFLLPPLMFGPEEMEALALGRPVLSTYVAGIPELVDATNCGYLVPAGSVGELAKGMKELLGSSVERLRAMGREGARRVAERHDACVEARKLANLFRAVVSNEELGVQENRAARERGSSNDSMGSVVG